MDNYFNPLNRGENVNQNNINSGEYKKEDYIPAKYNNAKDEYVGKHSKNAKRNAFRAFLASIGIAGLLSSSFTKASAQSIAQQPNNITSESHSKDISANYAQDEVVLQDGTVYKTAKASQHGNKAAIYQNNTNQVTTNDYVADEPAPTSVELPKYAPPEVIDEAAQPELPKYAPPELIDEAAYPDPAQLEAPKYAPPELIGDAAYPEETSATLEAPKYAPPELIDEAAYPDPAQLEAPKYAPPEIMDEPVAPEPIEVELLKYAPPELIDEPIAPEPSEVEALKYAPPELMDEPVAPEPIEVELLKYAPPELIDEPIAPEPSEVEALKYAPPELME